FHEDFLGAPGGQKRARAFHDFPRHGESSGRSVRPLLVEQYPVWLRRKKRSAEQGRLCHFFASSDACQSRADQQRPVRRHVFGLSPSNSLQHCRSQREVRLVKASANTRRVSVQHCEKRRRTAALQNAGDKSELPTTATFWSAA